MTTKNVIVDFKTGNSHATSKNKAVYSPVEPSLNRHSYVTAYPFRRAFSVKISRPLQKIWGLINLIVCTAVFHLLIAT